MGRSLTFLKLCQQEPPFYIFKWIKVITRRMTGGLQAAVSERKACETAIKQRSGAHDAVQTMRWFDDLFFRVW